MRFKFEIQCDIQIGRLFFRMYRTQGPGFSLRFRRSSQHLVGLWLAWAMFELSWLHDDECYCHECIPF